MEAKFKICNYSDNPQLYEIPTINKILDFSKKNIELQYTVFAYQGY